MKLKKICEIHLVPLVVPTKKIWDQKTRRNSHSRCSQGSIFSVLTLDEHSTHYTWEENLFEKKKIRFVTALDLNKDCTLSLQTHYHREYEYHECYIRKTLHEKLLT